MSEIEFLPSEKNNIKVGDLFLRCGGVYNGDIYVLSKISCNYVLISISDGTVWDDPKDTIEKALESSHFGKFIKIKNPLITIKENGGKE